MEKLDRAIADGHDEHKLREEVGRMADQLGEQASKLMNQGEEALKSANREQEVAANTNAPILRGAQRPVDCSVAAGQGIGTMRSAVLENMKNLAQEAETIQRHLDQATHPPPAPDISAGVSSTAVKWVQADRECGDLLVGHEARGALRVVPPGAPINVLTILGPARRGKSFLMNALNGSSGVFCVSPAAVPCTAGADLSPILLPLPVFARGSGGSAARTPPAPGQPAIAFVDMEGQGDKSTEHGVRLATTFLLISRVGAGVYCDITLLRVSS